MFFNLGAIRPGDHLSILRADGSTARFTAVTEVGSYPRDQFPSQAVYGPSTTPVLRLITCGGQYHKGEGYEGNVVVFADMDPDIAPAVPATPSSRPTPAPTHSPPRAAATCRPEQQNPSPDADPDARIRVGQRLLRRVTLRSRTDPNALADAGEFAVPFPVRRVEADPLVVDRVLPRPVERELELPVLDESAHLVRFVPHPQQRGLGRPRTRVASGVPPTRAPGTGSVHVPPQSIPQ